MRHTYCAQVQCAARVDLKGVAVDEDNFCVLSHHHPVLVYIPDDVTVTMQGLKRRCDVPRNVQQEVPCCFLIRNEAKPGSPGELHGL